MNLNITLPESELKKFNGMLDEIQKITGKEAEIVVRNASRDAARIALKMTPITEKRERWLETPTGGWIKAGKVKPVNRGYKKVIGPGGRRYGGIYISRGQARSGWVGVMERLGIGRKTEANSRKYSDLKHNKTFGNVETVLTNLVPFIEQLETGRYIKGKPANILPKTIIELNKKTEQILAKLATKAKRRI
jgi:hypothetical protein